MSSKFTLLELAQSKSGNLCQWLLDDIKETISELYWYMYQETKLSDLEFRLMMGIGITEFREWKKKNEIPEDATWVEAETLMR